MTLPRAPSTGGAGGSANQPKGGTVANTWIAEIPLSREVVAEFRSVDFDPVELYEKHGEVDVRDKTNDMRLLGTVRKAVDIHSGLKFIHLYPNV